ncbi:MAG TPA: glycosyltransferase family 4 protein [Pyrinomonadaceae bacterium]|nr:glycosyltransferase family 4 protein [Pyrinomonadaceae bacterium]
MKIALCKSHFFGPVSGADEILLSYATSLRRAGYDVEVVLLHRPAETDRFCRRLRHAGVPIVSVIQHSIAFTIVLSLRRLFSAFLLLFLWIPRSEEGLRRIWQVLLGLISRAHYKDCRAFFSGSKYDLLHVFTPDTGATLIIRAGKEAGIPVLYHEMGTPQYLPALDPHYRRLEKVLPLCSEVAALSPTLAKQWSERFPFLSVAVLPLITEDCEMINLSGMVTKNGNHETIFGCAARIEEGKGPFVLADAMALVRQKRNDVHVRLAGIGPADQEMKARVRQLRLDGSWEFVGAYDGTIGRSAFMRTLDVFVLPSFAEGTSKSVIEAMSHGLPIITTNVGGSADLLTPDAGILVPPGDSSALADAMQRLASDPTLRKEMGQVARDRYLKLFAPEAVLSMLVTTYSRLTGNNGHEPSSSNGRHPWATYHGS